jgi:hypothetical protein
MQIPTDSLLVEKIASSKGVPGWPEFACCTASIANVRIVLMQSWSSWSLLIAAPYLAAAYFFTFHQSNSHSIYLRVARRLSNV